MKIYIDTKKCVWVLGGRKLIRRITVAADWQKIERKFEENFELRNHQLEADLSGKAKAIDEFTFKSIGAWGGFPSDSYGDKEVKIDAPV
jgi:hypothetical protein